jgi:hypothetical protein
MKRMDQETKAFLEGMERRLSAHIGESVRSAEARIDVHFEQIDRRFDKIDQRFEKIDQRFEELEGSGGPLEAMETRIITAFWNWSRPMETRMRRLDHSDTANAERLTALEERMARLEMRHPPAA